VPVFLRLGLALFMAVAWGIQGNTGEQIGEQIRLEILKNEAGRGVQGFIQ
jgi:hypothetical protein